MSQFYNYVNSNVLHGMLSSVYSGYDLQACMGYYTLGIALYGGIIRFSFFVCFYLVQYLHYRYLSNSKPQTVETF